MTQFDQDLADGGVDELMLAMGRDATYIAPGGTPIELTAIVGDERTNELPAEAGRNQERVRDVSFCKDPDGPYGGVASPKLAAEIEIDGERWAIRSFIANGPVLVQVSAARVGSIEKSVPQYRGNPR